jgi:hypothetical protein
MRTPHPGPEWVHASQLRTLSGPSHSYDPATTTTQQPTQPVPGPILHALDKARPHGCGNDWRAWQVLNLRPLLCESTYSSADIAGPDRLLRSGPGMSLPQESVGDRRCPVRHVPTMSQPRMGRVPAVMRSQGRSSSSRPFIATSPTRRSPGLSAPRARGYRRNVRNGKAPPAVAGGAGSLGRLALPGDGYDASVKKPVAVPKAPARPQGEACLRDRQGAATLGSRPLAVSRLGSTDPPARHRAVRTVPC